MANTNVTATVLDFDINIGRTTKTVRGLTMGMSCVGTLTVTDWEGIRITAPSTVGSPTITNKRAIITESGAGNVGFGTLFPTIQLHRWVQYMRNSRRASFYRSTNTVTQDESPTLVFASARGTGTGWRCPLVARCAGAIFFYGYRLGSYSQHAYIHSTYTQIMGSGCNRDWCRRFGKARVTILKPMRQAAA